MHLIIGAERMMGELDSQIAFGLAPCRSERRALEWFPADDQLPDCLLHLGAIAQPSWSPHAVITWVGSGKVHLEMSPEYPRVTMSLPSMRRPIR